MIDLKTWMEVVDYRITEGGDYYWGSKETPLYCLDSWSGDQDGYSFTILFDTVTQEVFEVQAFDYLHQHAYRLINPTYSDQHLNSDEIAWDEVGYINLEVDDDWIQKARDIINAHKASTNTHL